MTRLCRVAGSSSGDFYLFSGRSFSRLVGPVSGRVSLRVWDGLERPTLQYRLVPTFAGRRSPLRFSRLRRSLERILSLECLDRGLGFRLLFLDLRNTSSSVDRSLSRDLPRTVRRGSLLSR